jgi:hypothetical protein
MYTSLKGRGVEPLWIMIPVDASTARGIDSIEIKYGDGIVTQADIDRFSQSKIK